MEVSESTKQYLSQIGEKVSEYYNALEFAKEYVLNTDEMNNSSIIDCMLMSILWVASRREESLTEEDVCMYLNIETDVEPGDISVEIVPEMQDWSLEEVLDYVNGSRGLV